MQKQISAKKGYSSAMKKKNIYSNKMLLTGLLFSCILLVILATTTLSSKKANAALLLPIDSVACTTICVELGTLQAAVAEMGVAIASGMAAATSEIYAKVSLVTIKEEATIVAAIMLTSDSFILAFRSLWYTKTLPLLNNMARQFTAMEANQARVISSFMDAVDMHRIERSKQKETIKSDREHRVGDNVMVATSMTKGMNRAAKFKNSYRDAATKVKSPRSSGSFGFKSSAGVASDLGERWKNYLTRYCKKDFNNGVSGCEEDMPYADMDVNATKTIFSKETIDLTNEELRTATNDLITNLAEPLALNTTPESAVKSTTGQKNILSKESYKAKRQTVYNALYHIISRRAPGSQMGTLLTPLRKASGIETSQIAINPSYNELIHAMTTERFRSGNYSIKQMDEPENAKRELVIQQAYQVILLNDQIELLDRQALILAAQISDNIKDTKIYGVDTQ